jgi:hypothetical protein
MPSLTSRRTASLSSGLVLGLGLLIAGAGLVAALLFEQERIAVTGIITFLLLALAKLSIRLSILCVFGFLIVLGDVRRILIPVAGWSGADPLLMIAPAYCLLLFSYVLVSKRIALTSTLSRWMLLFTAIMFLQIFNPNQGGLTVGIAGGILLIIPTFWFWIGQAYGSRRMGRALFYYLLLPLSIPALLMGFIQLFYGYLPYQKEWYRIAGYSAIGTDINSLRPISIFVNITEFLIFLSIVTVLLAAVLLHRQGGRQLKLLALLLVPVTAASLLLAGSRGPIVIVPLAIALLWTLKGKTVRSWIPRFALAVCIGAGGLVWGLTQVGDLATQNERVGASLTRQAELVEDGGTAGIHAYLAWNGVLHGIRHPLGSGIGSITRAGAKFGDGSLSSEIDITNMFMATGVGGGIIYLILVVLVSVTAIRHWHRSRSLIALCIVGVLFVTGKQWLSAGHYVITPLVWLVIGILDRLHTDELDASTPPE